MIAVVGNPTLDISLFKKRTFKSFGGSATYSSFALRALGERVALLGSIGPDFPEEFLSKFHSIDLYLKNVKKTTKFELDYRDGERKVRNIFPGKPITTFPPISPDAVHLGAVMNELSLSLLKTVPDVTISIDAQGVLRRRKKDSTILLMNRKAKKFFDRADILKFSVEEAEAACGEKTPSLSAEILSKEYDSIVLVTQGERGAFLFDKTIKFIPPFKTVTKDPTGAGDVFTSAFLSQYIRLKDSVKSARFASAAASFLVEKMGPEGFPSRKATLRRASL